MGVEPTKRTEQKDRETAYAILQQSKRESKPENNMASDHSAVACPPHSPEETYLRTSLYHYDYSVL